MQPRAKPGRMLGCSDVSELLPFTDFLGWAVLGRVGWSSRFSQGGWIREQRRQHRFLTRELSCCPSTPHFSLKRHWSSNALRPKIKRKEFRENVTQATSPKLDNSRRKDLKGCKKDTDLDSISPFFFLIFVWNLDPALGISLVWLSLAARIPKQTSVALSTGPTSAISPRLQYADCDTTPSAIGSAIARPYLALSCIHVQVGSLDCLILSLLGGSTAQ